MIYLIIIYTQRAQMHPENHFCVSLRRPTFEMAVHSMFVKFSGSNFEHCILCKFFFSIFFVFGSGINKQNSTQN